MNKIHAANLRLLDLAGQLETLPDEPPVTVGAKRGFCMKAYRHPCGTPSCALGFAWHWGLLPQDEMGQSFYGLSGTDWLWLFGTVHIRRSAHAEARVLREFVAARAGGAAAWSYANG